MLNQITSLTDFIKLLPKLVRHCKQFDGLWDPEQSADEFADKLIEVFRGSSAVFLEELDDGFRYVAVLHRDDSEAWYFWLFYMNPKCRDFTRSVIAEICEFCRTKNAKKLRFSTTRTTRSYERWVTKFGANRHAIVYQLEL